MERPYDEWLDFARYLWEIVPSGLSATSVDSYISEAMAYVKVVQPAVSVVRSPMLTQWLRRVKQIPRQSAFMDAAPVSLIASVVRDEAASLATRVVCMLQWFLCLRVGQVTTARTTEYQPLYDLLRGDVWFAPDGRYVRLTLKKAKNDPRNQGSCRYLLEATDPTGFSAVQLLRRYFKETEGFAGSEPLMRHADGRCVTPAHVRTLLKFHAVKLGLNPEVISAHSLRSGSATQLHAEGWDLQTIMMWGSWASEAGAIKYIRMTSDVAVAVTESLGFGQASSRQVLPSRPRLVVH